MPGFAAPAMQTCTGADVQMRLGLANGAGGSAALAASHHSQLLSLLPQQLRRPRQLHRRRLYELFRHLSSLCGKRM